MNELVGEYRVSGNSQKDNATSPSPLTDAEVANLESLSNAELISLVKRMACQCGLVANMSEKQIYQAGLDRLAKLFLTLPESEAKEIGNTFDKWCDRTKGKPKQSIDTTVTVGIIEIVAEVERRRNQVIDVTPK